MALDPVTAGIDAVTAIVNKIWPDKTQQERDQIAAAVQMVAAQTDINKAEASNNNLFVAGWRPSVGWVCSSGFAVQFVIGPLAQWFATLAGHPVAFPQLDLGTMMPLLLGMLGLGGMRTYEKTNGVNTGH